LAFAAAAGYGGNARLPLVNRRRARAPGRAEIRDEKPSPAMQAPAPSPRRDRLAATGIKRILVPVDFSTAGKPALRYAKSLAQLTGARVCLVHVMERIYQVNASYDGEEFSHAQLDTSRMREMITRKIGALQAGMFRGIRTAFEIREGVAHHEIVEAARTSKASLVVMATHGYTGLQHVLLGSTTERVVRHAPCPVLVVRSALLPPGKPKAKPSRRKARTPP
jgi:nucleotide-binding universal stress UspA family protein